jgi:histidyl-tRNA synthetase
MIMLRYDELMKINNFGIVEEMFTKANIQKHQRPIVKEYCKNLTELRRFYTRIIYETLDLRNKILDGMKQFNELNAKVTKHLDLEQLGKFIDCSRHICCKYKIDIFSTWGIKKVGSK